VLLETGRSAIHAAARLGRVGAVRFFAESGVETGPDEDGTSCLHEALKCDDDDGDSPWEFTEEGRQLLRQLATPDSVSTPDNTEEDGLNSYPLHTAAQYGRTQAVRMLMTQGVDVAADDQRGRTALHRALLARNAFGSPGWIEVLSLLATADTINKADSDGDTPLHYAALVGYKAGVEALKQAGADASIENGDGFTPAQVALEREATELLPLLEDL